jgi:hypothetical protein
MLILGVKHTTIREPLAFKPLTKMSTTLYCRPCERLATCAQVQARQQDRYEGTVKGWRRRLATAAGEAGAGCDGVTLRDSRTGALKICRFSVEECW